MKILLFLAPMLPALLGKGLHSDGLEKVSQRFFDLGSGKSPTLADEPVYDFGQENTTVLYPKQQKPFKSLEPFKVRAVHKLSILSEDMLLSLINKVQIDVFILKGIISMLPPNRVSILEDSKARDILSEAGLYAFQLRNEGKLVGGKAKEVIGQAISALEKRFQELPYEAQMKGPVANAVKDVAELNLPESQEGQAIREKLIAYSEAYKQEKEQDFLKESMHELMQVALWGGLSDEARGLITEEQIKSIIKNAEEKGLEQWLDPAKDPHYTKFMDIIYDGHEEIENALDTVKRKAPQDEL